MTRPTGRRAAAWLVWLLAVALPAGAQDASAQYRDAEAAFAGQQWDAALAGFKAFQRGFPDDTRAPRALYRVGECLVQLERFAEAGVAFHDVYTRYPDADVSDPAIFNEGYTWYRAEDWQRSAAAYFLYTKKGTDPSRKAQAWYWRAEGLYNLERYQDAVGAYQQMLASPAAVLAEAAVAGLVPYARYSIAVSQFSLEQYQACLTTVQELLKAVPNSPVEPDARWYGARALRALQRPAEAITWLQQLVEQHPEASLVPDALYALVELYQDAGQAAEAQATRERLERDYPGSAVATGASFQLAAAALKKGDFAAAKKLYTEALQAGGPGEADGLLGLAEANFGLQDWPAAADGYRRLLAKAPDGPLAEQARLRLGETLIHQQDYAAAEPLYRELLATNPAPATAVLAHYNLALALAQQQRLEPAIAEYREAARVDPTGQTGADALLEVGRLTLAAQRYDEAAAAYDTWLRRPGPPAQAAQAQFGLGEARFGAEQWPAAQEAYQAVVDQHPDSPLVERAMYRLIEVHTRLGQAEAAEAVRQALQQKFPQSALGARALLTEGTTAFREQDYPRAIRAFDDFIARFPDDPQIGVAKANLAASLYNSTDLPEHWQRAATLYTELGRDYPQVSDESWFWAGVAWQEAGEPEQAVAVLRDFLKAYPDHARRAQAQLNLGRALVSAKQPAEASEAFEVALAAAGTDAAVRGEVRWELAWALIGAGRPQDGYQQFSVLVKELPDHPLAPDARFRLANRANQEGHYDEAAAAYRTWLEQYPDQPLRPRVVYNLAVTLEAQNDYAEAARQYAEAARLLGEADRDLREQAAYKQGYALYRAGDLPAAMAALQAYDAAWPQGKLAVDAAYYRGQVLAAEGDWAAAGAIFQQIANDHADHYLAGNARYDYGVSLQNREDYPAAVAVYQALADDAGQPAELLAEANWRLGEVWYAQQEYDKALPALLKAEQSAVPSAVAPARYWAGLAYQNLGEAGKAREKLSALINDFPGTDWAKKAKAALEKLTG